MVCLFKGFLVNIFPWTWLSLLYFFLFCMSVCLCMWTFWWQHDFILFLYCHHFSKFNCLFNVWLESRAPLRCYRNSTPAIGIQTRSIITIETNSMPKPMYPLILIHFNEIKTFSIFWWMPKILFSLNLRKLTNEISKAARDFFTVLSLIKFFV